MTLVCHMNFDPSCSQSEGMISMDQWAQIRRLHRSEGVGVKAIARRLGIARNTVRAALAADLPPRYERARSGSITDEFEPLIAQQLVLDPLMPASVIAHRVGWVRSGSLFRAKVASMRPLFAGVDPTDRTVYKAGEIVQCDLWFPKDPIPIGAGLSAIPPVLTMVSAWCGYMMAVMIPTRTTDDLLAGMWCLICDLGVVPKTLVWDHESAIGRDRLCDRVVSFSGTLGCRVIQVRKASPEHKGVVERSHRFLRSSFEPARTYTSPQDFNSQLTDWLGWANDRVLRRTGKRPSQLIGTDRAAMSPLPPVEPDNGFNWQGRLGRDYYVRALGNDYSVDPEVVGRIVQVRASLRRVQIRCAGQLVGDHERAWGAGGVITDPAHKARAADLRRRYDQIRATRTKQLSASAGMVVPTRDLASYDQLFAQGNESTNRAGAVA